MKKNEFSKSVVVIEDEKILNRLLAEQIAELGFSVTSFTTWQEAKLQLLQSQPDLVFLDMRLPDADGLAILPELSIQAPVVVLTAYGTIDQAVEAMKLGAAEYLSKPINIEEIELVITRVLEKADLKRSVQFLTRRQKAQTQSFQLRNSPALSDVNGLIDVVANENTMVLIEGESGVGKELVAQEVHNRSRRSSKNFVTIDCCTLQEELFESELFGHERGAFTGADRAKEGLIEGANQGTLFLDEIGEVSASIQAKLLRVIETGQFRRVGSTKTHYGDVRIVAATNRDLSEMVDAGDFRADLFYRLNTFAIHVPPLRDRPEDIPVLARHFLSNHDFSRRITKTLSQSVDDTLLFYSWPGNVRELRNVIERAIILSQDASVIEVEHLGLSGVTPSGVKRDRISLSFDHEPTLEEVKRVYLCELDKRHSGRRVEMARALGVSERNLYRLIGKYGLGNSD